MPRIKEVALRNGEVYKSSKLNESVAFGVADSNLQNVRWPGRFHKAMLLKVNSII